MLFQIYGATAGWQLLGWLLAFCGLVGINELARRTKAGGLFVFGVVPAILTVYFIVIAVAAGNGAEWAVNNQTHIYMNGWFHYAKLYAALTGSIGFMMIKYEWGIGKKHWFKAFPFVIVAINILIAVASDLESLFKGIAAGSISGGWWLSSEGIWLYGGWWNLLNALAGVLNIFIMTGWWSTTHSKDRKDMIWADMTWVFIITYDIWNFTYTYLNLPTHSWYCGLALLLAPTFANALWNKGGWIQNRANTLTIWCMFAQVWPLFQNDSVFSVLPSVYGDTYAAYGNVMRAEVMPTTANPKAQGVCAILAFASNVIGIAFVIKKAKELGVNPYTHDIWMDQADYKEAAARIDTAAE